MCHRVVRQDRIVGAVIDVEFPETPSGGWKVGSADEAPNIRAVMTLFKLAEGMDRVLGKSQARRSRWSVSQEFLYDKKKSGFLFSLDDLRSKPEVDSEVMRLQSTPDDIRAGGWVYVPWEKATDGIRASFDQGKIKAAYKGVKPVMLAGGINGQVHYHGLALTENPAEPSAELSQLEEEETAKWAGVVGDVVEVGKSVIRNQ